MSKTLTHFSFLFFLSVLFGPGLLIAQTIQGNVQDSSSGEPLYGATILQQGTQNGTVTDQNGSFQLDLRPQDDPAVLVVSYVGYYQKEVSLESGQTSQSITIALEPSSFRGSTIFVDDVRV